MFRGDVIVAAKAPIEVANLFEANIVWMDQDAGHHGRAYWLKTSTTRGKNKSVTSVQI
ncbi:MAG: hypothetical protein ACNYPE_02615 [Candidatus Azotimanducaceae bacterium WSBS_2022_MAG_OTU7]